MFLNIVNISVIVKNICGVCIDVEPMFRNIIVYAFVGIKSSGNSYPTNKLYPIVLTFKAISFIAPDIVSSKQ